MNCAVCSLRPSELGVLCDECRDDVAVPLGMVPEQVLGTFSTRTDAALIDGWGRPHSIEPRTMIGRTIERTGLMLLDSSVSRHHAHLVLDRQTNAWTLRDLGSANGTTLNGQPVTDAVVVQHGDRIGIGPVSFYFVLGATALPQVEVDAAAITTVRPVGRSPVRDAPDFDEREVTDVGLPTLPLTLIEPTGGGGGVLEVQGASIHLTAIQFELLSLLADRMERESHQPSLVRGFVRTAELLGSLSWDSRDPNEHHLKQLVRRVRRMLIRDNIGDLVESRPRFGYRLRVIPQRAPRHRA